MTEATWLIIACDQHADVVITVRLTPRIIKLLKERTNELSAGFSKKLKPYQYQYKCYWAHQRSLTEMPKYIQKELESKDFVIANLKLKAIKGTSLQFYFDTLVVRAKQFAFIAYENRTDLITLATTPWLRIDEVVENYNASQL